jgi:hypothetical protein
LVCIWFGFTAARKRDVRVGVKKDGRDGAGLSDGRDDEERARKAVVQRGGGSRPVCGLVSCRHRGDCRQDGEAERATELSAGVQQA